MSQERQDYARPRTLAGGTILQAVPAMRDDRLGQAALDLAVALLRSGARAMVAGTGGALVGELQALGGEWIEIDFAPSRPIGGRRSVEALANLIRAEHVDLVHAHGPDAARVALAANKRRTAALVTSYIGLPPAPSWRRPKEEAQAMGDLVLACSGYAADLIEQRHRVAGERVVVIPRSVDTARFDPAAVRSDRVTRLLAAWRIRPEARMVLAPGRLAPSQGQTTLIDAVRALVNGGLRGVVFVVAGDRPSGDDYAALVAARIAAQGLGPIFRCVGHCADMPAAYAAADVVVLPTDRATTFSAMAVEAQAMGRPVIASDLGALPELMLAPPVEDTQSPRTGWLVPPRDALALARALAAVLALDDEVLDDVALQARQFADGHFSREQVASMTLAAYDALLQGDG